MGYCIDVTIDNLIIPEDKVIPALNAINAMHDGTRCFAWVLEPLQGGFFHIVDAFRAWRYVAEELETGAVAVTYFRGEKQGSCKSLFEAIAPFVEDGATVSMRGEDGAMWQYLFQDGSLREREGRIVWE